MSIFLVLEAGFVLSLLKDLLSDKYCRILPLIWIL